MPGKSRFEYDEFAPVFTDGSLAYELGTEAVRFPPERDGEPEISVRPKRKTQKQPVAKPHALAYISPVTALLLVGILSVVMLMIFNYITLDKLATEVTTLQHSVSDLKQENIDLTTKYGLTFDLAAVKATAEAAGMSKPSTSQIYYMDLGGEDVVTVYTPQKGGLSSVRNSLLVLFGTVREYFR